MKREIEAMTGSMQQLAFLRPVCYTEGRAGGMQAIDWKNGPMRLTVMRDKCLDIAELSWKGVQLSFLSKPGLFGRSPFDTRGIEAQRSIMGGFLFTAGCQNICAPCTDEGQEYPMHGRIRTTPAEHVCADAYWDGSIYRMRVSGEMRQAQLFGENITLRRTWETEYGSSVLTLTDRITNHGFCPEPLMLLYHFNFGFPFLTPETRVYLPSRSVQPRDAAAAEGVSGWTHMDAPVPNAPEQVFLHDLEEEEEGKTWACIYDPSAGLGVRLEFNRRQLPWFMQWKSKASGDYVMGLEPANASVFGRLYQKKHGGLEMLKPGESKVIQLKISIIEKEPNEYEAIRD